MPVAADSNRAGDLLALGRITLRSQAFSDLLGTQLIALQSGHAELRLPIAACLLQQHGFVHGGVLAYLADNAMAFAAGSLFGEAVVSAALQLNFLQPARGRELVATASVAHAGKSLVVCRCDIVAVCNDGSGVLCAAAQGTVSRLRSRVDATLA